MILVEIKAIILKYIIINIVKKLKFFILLFDSILFKKITILEIIKLI